MTTSSNGGSVSGAVSSRAWLTHTQMRRLGAATRQPPVTAAPRRAVPAQAGGPRGTQLAGQLGEGRQLPGGAVRQRREVDLTAARPADEVGERQRALAIRQRLALGGHGLVEPPPADVVLAAHEQRPAPARRQRLGDDGQLVRGQLALQGLGLRAHHDAAAGGGAGEGRRQKVREALAHAGAGLEKTDAAVPEDAGGGGRELRLSGPPAKAGEPRRQARLAGGRGALILPLRVALRTDSELGAPAVGVDREEGRADRRRAARRRPRAAAPRPASPRSGPAARAAPSGRPSAAHAPRRRGPAARAERRLSTSAAVSASGRARCACRSMPSSAAMMASACRSSSGYSSRAASSVSNHALASGGRPALRAPAAR